MSISPELQHVRQAPGMHICAPSFYTAVAFLCGYDMALRGEMLEGFREWLIVNLDTGNNLWWPALVLRLLPNTLRPADYTSTDVDREAIEALFRVLESFMATKDGDGGLTRIRQDYANWLRAQQWHRPEFDPEPADEPKER